MTGPTYTSTLLTPLKNQSASPGRKDLPDGEYTVAAVDEKDQLVGWVDMKLGEIKNAAVEGDNNDKVVAAQAGVMSATDWWMIGASMLIPLLTASMIYAFRRPRRS